jgi:hypothetical protein
VRPRGRQAIRASLWPGTVRRALNGWSAQATAVGTERRSRDCPAWPRSKGNRTTLRNRGRSCI